MAAQSQAAVSNADLFDAYFKRADLDRDGRISGHEAVSFFQGSNLPKNVLAQIWTFADQNRTGFLGRPEFYNYLKLVTIAQSKQELTPDIVRAAFYGPVGATIPAPQINLPPTQGPQPVLGASPNPAFSSASSQSTNMNQQYSLSNNNQLARPPQPVPGGAVRLMPSVASQGFSAVHPAHGTSLSNSTIQINAGDAKTNGTSTGMTRVMDRSVNLPATQGGFGPGATGLAGLSSRPAASVGMVPSLSTTKSPLAQNGFASGSLFGGNAQKKDGPGATSSTGSVSVSSATVPVSAAALSPTKQGIAPGTNPQVVAAQPQQQWPRLTQSDHRRYTEIFVKVDKDKDGKITGEEAHTLFVSWGLSNEVLKQVWDLADQDNDSMLSLREFCIALYLMERHRERRPLPSVLPSHIVYDLPPAVQISGGFGQTDWGSSHVQQHTVRPEFGPNAVARPPSGNPRQPTMPGFVPHPLTRPPTGKPPLPAPTSVADNRAQPKEQKAKVPVLEKHLVDQVSEGEQKSLNSKYQEATEANKKVEELEKDIKESREKMEFYRAKMQELVLYKSRCDTRLNETTARVSADKHEVELLAKKYEDKYRQTGDVASRLTIEEATFRDIQERKMEMYRSIVKFEQDGGTSESLKTRVEQIQSNLEELVKSLNERCKTYGLRSKPTTLVELPFGWQPGVQVGAVDWDEDWDKFEDEGFTSVKELTLDVENVVAPPKTKSKPVNKGKNAVDESGEVPASSNAEEKDTSVFKEAYSSETREEHTVSVAQRVTENGAAHEQADAFEVRSPMGSQAEKRSHESPHKEFQDGHSEKADVSPHAKELLSDQRGAESSSFGYKSFIDPVWGTVDHNDEAGSIWDVKGMEDDDLFGSGNFSLNPIKTGSKFGGSGFLKKGSSIFADSVPGTPFSSTYSPRKSNEGPDENLPGFSRFDSFKSTDGGFQPQETLSRFDSMHSTAYEYGKGFPAFDDSNRFESGPFRSSFGSETPRTDVDAFSPGPFRTSLGTETPRFEVDLFGAGPFRSSFGNETPRESDPFGSGQFRSSFGAETPRTESDPFGSVGLFNSSFGAETPRRESDPFGSVGPSRPSLESESRRSDWMGSDSFNYRRPVRSSFSSETPRSEVDPFGSSGPFRSTLDDETPRGDSDPFRYSGSFTTETPKGTTTSNWSAF